MSDDAAAGKVAHTTLGSIEYRVRGTGAPVLVLHGTPGGVDQAELMARFLPPARFAAILVSRPGYLGTELGSRRTFDDEGDLLVALLDLLEVPRAGVLCWSGSGPTGYRLAVRHPDRLTALVALDAVSQRIDAPKIDFSDRLLFGTRPGAWLIKVLAEHQPGQIVSATLSSEGSLTDDQLQRRVAEVIGDDGKRQFVLDLSATMSLRGARKAGYQHDIDLLASLPPLDLETITRPCLIVHGGADSDVPPEHGTRAAAQIPSAELLTLETGTHLAFFTHPDAERAQTRALAYLAG